MPHFAKLAVIDWLTHQARMLPGGIPALIDAYCRRLVAQGVPLWRSAWNIRMLHPELRAITYIWWHGQDGVEEIERTHGNEFTHEYLNSPVAAIVDDGADGLRHPIRRMVPPWPYPILGELHRLGGTDYAAWPVLFSSGRRHAATFASNHPDGFTTADLDLIDGTLPVLSTLLEVLALRRLATNLLNIYVGRQAGERILSGDIRRGTGGSLRAVLWYCDLRGFTNLADRLEREDLIALLNGYFEIMDRAVQARGGEILKFIGDAVLAMFPLAGDSAAPEADALTCALALDAADEAVVGMARLNIERAIWGQPTLHFGIALHLGDVMFGNVGAATRLDYTVIGPAVNLVSRIETLCKRLERTVLTSAAFARACRTRLLSLGLQPVRGKREPVEVFGLADD
ncbi:Adenylate cyclase [uncultured Gammaproteobacteria bacterium]